VTAILGVSRPAHGERHAPSFAESGQEQTADSPIWTL